APSCGVKEPPKRRRAGLSRLKPVPQVLREGGMHRGEGSGRRWREAEEKVEVALAEGGAFGMRAGHGNGFDVLVAGPVAEQGSELAAEAVGCGVVIRGAVASNGGEEVEVGLRHDRRRDRLSHWMY